MKQVFLSLAITVLCPLFLYAQNDYEYIEVILEDGKTIKGITQQIIDPRGFNSISFTTIDGDSKKIDLEYIHQINTKGKNHYRKTLKQGGYDILISSFFLGKVSVYEGFTPEGEPLYFIKRENEAEPRQINEKGINTFLNYYFSECNNWKKLSAPIPYKKRNIVALIERNPLCFSKDGQLNIDYDKEANSFNFESGWILGWHNSFLDPIVDQFSIRVPEFTRANSVSFGGLIKINKGKYFSLEQDFLYTHHVSKADYTNFPDFSNPHALKFKLHYLEFISLLKFTLPSEQIEPHIGFGIYNGFYLSSKVQKNNPVDEAFTFDFDTHSTGVLGTLGVSYKLDENRKVGLEYRFVRIANYLKVIPYGQIYNLDKRRHFLGAYIHTAFGK